MTTYAAAAKGAAANSSSQRPVTSSYEQAFDRHSRTLGRTLVGSGSDVTCQALNQLRQRVTCHLEIRPAHQPSAHAHQPEAFTGHAAISVESRGVSAA